MKLSIRSAIEKYNLEGEIRKLLAQVRDQAVELKLLERRYPGISMMEKDKSGHYLLSEEISEEELLLIMAECEQKYG